ncbi:hypothetical protein PISL3812_00951 [Talaromyces islandicus]|uniref:FAD-binding PCMH-type domain-containing protein n=1 Tax=Talaromyces islandicus TaxID=28573 RepID=A0A0U1LKP2_TALIS|nr:hypothetical protein PISL3812_00951 [Talaromyces islandicus]
MAELDLMALEGFLKTHPEIKCTLPSSPQYLEDKKVFLLSRMVNPLAIAHPETAEQVSVLVQFLRSNGMKFTVRGGGHNLQGLSIEEGALTIDMRAFTSVDIAADRETATVGAGILQEELCRTLWDNGLATSTGSIPSVGYLGWAMYGGYGPFSSNWGLGVDQIVAATLVDANGAIVKADDNLLKVIRGAGGAFGVIVDISIKLYPLTSLLTGIIFYDSQDINKTFCDYNVKYQEICMLGLPKQLSLQQMVVNGPPGRVFAVAFTWSSENIEEGGRWCDKIASLGAVITNTVELTTIPNWYAGNATLIPPSMYGSFRTHSVREMTQEVTECIGRALENMPKDPGTMLSIHQLRTLSETPASPSVFATRESHFMLEIVGCATKTENAERSEQWAVDVWEDVRKTNANNLLDRTYISLAYVDGPLQLDTLTKYFGGHTCNILTTKKNYDPENVFGLTVPRLGNLLYVFFAIGGGTGNVTLNTDTDNFIFES